MKSFLPLAAALSLAAAPSVAAPNPPAPKVCADCVKSDITRLAGPEARGRAQRMLEEAAAYRSKVVAEAQGEADRFEKLLTQYQKSPEVTRERLYLDAVQRVMSSTSKVLVDVPGGNNVLYLPLDRMGRPGDAPAASAGRSTGEEVDRVTNEVMDRLRRETAPTRQRERR